MKQETGTYFNDCLGVVPTYYYNLIGDFFRWQGDQAVMNKLRFSSAAKSPDPISSQFQLFQDISILIGVDQFIRNPSLIRLLSRSVQGFWDSYQDAVFRAFCDQYLKSSGKLGYNTLLKSHEAGPILEKLGQMPSNLIDFPDSIGIYLRPNCATVKSFYHYVADSQWAQTPNKVQTTKLWCAGSDTLATLTDLVQEATGLNTETNIAIPPPSYAVVRAVVASSTPHTYAWAKNAGFNTFFTMEIPDITRLALFVLETTCEDRNPNLTWQDRLTPLIGEPPVPKAS